MDGLLLLDKPEGITSHKAIDILRRIIAIKRIGHTGTLDPMATGLLICCVGRATRLSEYLVRADKTYEGELIFGSTSDTYDAEGTISEPMGDPPSNVQSIREAFDSLVGDIEQEVPKYSAIKVDGKRLYEYARKGEDVEQPRRKISVKKLELLSYDPPRGAFVAKVSSGTYIRSICHDVGKMLKCGAYMSALRRTRVGYYSLADAVTLDDLEAEPALARERLIPLYEALQHLPRVILTPEGLEKFLHGNKIQETDVKEHLLPQFGAHLPLQVVDEEKFYGILLRKRISRRFEDDSTSKDDASQSGDDKPDTYYKPAKVFPPEQ